MEFLTDPIAWWIEPFTGDPGFQRAVLAALLTVVATSVVGTWVVLRGNTYLAEALGHGVLPGVAIASLLGGDLMVGALVAAVVMVLGVRGVQRRSPLPGESAIGLLLVAMLALTVVLVAASDGIDEHQLEEFLFGSMLDTTGTALLRQVVVVALVAAMALVFHRPLLALTFDDVQAQLLGLRPRATEIAFLVLVALSVTASFEAVGGLLVFAFLVAPPATAALLVRRVPAIMATSVAVGSGSVLVGALLSHHLLGEVNHAHTGVGPDVSSPEALAMGASMAVVAVVAFLAVVLVRGAPDDRS